MDNQRKDILLSPKSVKTISMKSAYGDKYNNKEDVVYDFNSNKYIKSTNKVQDLINKYNKPINRKKDFSSTFNAMNPINVLYTPKNIPSRGFSSPVSLYNANTLPLNRGRDCKSPSIREETRSFDVKTEENRSFKDYYNAKQTRSPIRNIGSSYLENGDLPEYNYMYQNTNLKRSPSPYENLQRYPSCDNIQRSPSCDNLKRSPSFDNIQRSSSCDNLKRSQPFDNLNTKQDTLLYGPSVELTFPITFKILNSIYSFTNGLDTSIYFIEISSNISWIVKKDINSILELLDTTVLTSKELDKPVKDNIIITMLNRFPTNKKFQYFIMTDISKNIIYKGEYLLLNNIPYIFKLVGKALVSYNSNNRVHRIFILKECLIECGRDDYTFFIRNNQGSVELQASCKVERDEWVKDINLFIEEKL